MNIFIVQRAQNKDIKAIHIKLDELIASSTRASNLLIKAEEAPEKVLEQVEDIYKALARTSAEDSSDASRISITSTAVEQIMETVHSEISYTHISQENLS